MNKLPYLKNGEYANADVLNRPTKSLVSQLGNFTPGVMLTTGDIANSDDLVEASSQDLVTSVAGTAEMIERALAKIDGVSKATTEEYGITLLNDAINSRSSVMAATSFAVKTAYDKGSEALALAQSVASIPDSTLNVKGIVQLSSAIDSDSEALAATPKAVKTALASSKTSATTEVEGIVRLTDSYNTKSKSTAVTASAVKDLFDLYSTPGSTDAPGIVQLNDTVNSKSVEMAATTNSLRITYELAQEAKNLAIKPATTENAGIVQLYNGIDRGDDTLAATASAVKKAYDLAQNAATKDVPDGTTEIKGAVQLYAGVDKDSNSLAATASAVKKSYDLAQTVNNREASLTAKGFVQLYNGIDSSSAALAATASAVKTVYDLAQTANSKVIPDGTTSSKGLVKLYDDYNSSSTSDAATANALLKLKNYVDSQKVTIPVRKWADVLPSRKKGETYTNSKTYEIDICVDAGSNIKLKVQNITVSSKINGSSFSIPAGASYIIETDAETLLSWTELS